MSTEPENDRPGQMAGSVCYTEKSSSHNFFKTGCYTLHVFLCQLKLSLALFQG